MTPKSPTFRGKDLLQVDDQPGLLLVAGEAGVGRHRKSKTLERCSVHSSGQSRAVVLRRT